jgi:hypothetical protein
LLEGEAAVAGGFACCADSTLYTLNVTEEEITAVMPVFHSLMQLFLAAESEFLALAVGDWFYGY